MDDANNSDQAINFNEADGAIADDETSKADEIDSTNKSQDDYKCNWAHVVECKHPMLKPLPCTFVGCDRPVHHVCQGLFKVMYNHDHHLSVKCCLHHPNTPFKTTKPLSDQPQPPNSTSKSDDDKEDDDHPWIFKSPSDRVVTGKDLAFLKQNFLLPTAGNRAAKTAGRVELPTAGNRAAKTAGRVDSQVLYYPIFTMFACHTMSENIISYTNIVKDVIATLSSLRLSNTNCLAEYNAEVASWNAKRKDNNSSSTSIFDENVGEDGLSSQSTYDVSINALYHVQSIRPN